MGPKLEQFPIKRKGNFQGNCSWSNDPFQCDPVGTCKELEPSLVIEDMLEYVLV